MKLYGFWRSLATYRVRVGLALKGLSAEEISIDLLTGRQHDPSYKAVNPQSVVPTLILDSGESLSQSLAILEYLDETNPKPPLLPADPLGRARVRALAQIVVSDGHPLVTPRIRAYLDKELHLEEAAREKWQVHWTRKALEAFEEHLRRSPHGGQFCHGDAPTIADLCLTSHLIGMTAYLKQSPDYAPMAMRIFERCMQVDAFKRSHPMNQPDAPKK
jgi:maleylacetoacetate isomerase